MVSPDFTIKQGNTSPAIDAQLRDDGGEIDLEDGTVAFRMKHRSTDQVVSGLCAIRNAENGRVSYIWSDGDTDKPGKYDAEFIVDYSANPPESIAEFNVDETFPSDGFLLIEVTETLDT